MLLTDLAQDAGISSCCLLFDLRCVSAASVSGRTVLAAIGDQADVALAIGGAVTRRRVGGEGAVEQKSSALGASRSRQIGGMALPVPRMIDLEYLTSTPKGGNCRCTD